MAHAQCSESAVCIYRKHFNTDLICTEFESIALHFHNIGIIIIIIIIIIGIGMRNLLL